MGAVVSSATPERAQTGSPGERAHKLVSLLYPISRSLTGDGVRETLSHIAQRVPLAMHEVPTGTPVLDWTVPREWNIRDAWVKDAGGRRVIDFRDSNLHVVGYSTPIHATMPLDALRPHLHSLPDRPGAIPYKTSYWNETWGFCLEHERLSTLEDGDYEVCIDATLADGALTYGELLLEGERADEVLISCHVCHPSLANDNLSSIAVATLLAEELSTRRLTNSYRFVFVPGLIGPITWLARNEHALERVCHGLVLACTGDPGRATYKRSRRGDAAIDRAVEHVLKHAGDHRVDDFSPYGYDERQYCSPGFDLPVGCLMRTPHGEFPEYHTSDDDLALVTPAALGDTYDKLLSVVDVLERNGTWMNQSPKGEPQLGRRGIYKGLAGDADSRAREMALLWVLNLSDGSHSLLDIAERARMPFARVADAAATLREHDLLA